MGKEILLSADTGSVTALWYSSFVLTVVSSRFISHVDSAEESARLTMYDFSVRTAQ